MATEADVCEKWFRLADTNNDGAIQGSEAVTFFGRAGLPKATLMQIWELTAGNAPSMTKPQFFAALRLVSLAQSKGGTFQTHEGKAVIIGTAPPLPLPKLEGLASSPPALQRPQFGVAGVQGPQYPPMAAQEAMQVEALFTRLDRDRDGLVQGSECAGEFMNTGVDRGVLKDIWSAVAGNKPYLTSSDFLKCMYMIELTRKGIPLPKVLPPDPFPLVATAPQPPAGPGGGMPSYGMPADMSMPPRASFAQPEAQTYMSRLPPVDESRLSMLGPEDQARVLGEMKAGVEKDSQLFKAEQELEVGRAKREFYEKALLEIKMFKSRTDVRLLEVQEKARHAVREAEAVEKRYEESRKEAEEGIKKGGSLVQSIHEATERRREKEALLQQLQEEVTELEQTSPDDLRKVEEDVQAVQAAVAALEAKKNSLNAQLEAYRRQQDVLVRRKGDMEMAIAAAEAEVHSAKADVEQLKSKVEASKASDDAEHIQNLLLSAARVYTTVHTHASKAGIEIPAEARLSLYGRDLIWSEDMVATAGGEWDDWQEDGFVVVDAFPDTKDEMHQAIIDAVMAASSNEASGISFDLDKGPAGDNGPPAFTNVGFADANPWPEPQAQALAADAIVPAATTQPAQANDPFGTSDPFSGFGADVQPAAAAQPVSGGQSPAQESEQAPGWTAF
eukprot:evm.model.scf_431.1 EVM.evm.TU.scf_431.1   scf_431:11385-13403(-)